MKDYVLCALAVMAMVYTLLAMPSLLVYLAMEGGLK